MRALPQALASSARQPCLLSPALDPLQDFLRWWHLLVFVEGAIYQADEDNEQAAGGTAGGETAAAPASTGKGGRGGTGGSVAISSMLPLKGAKCELICMLLPCCRRRHVQHLPC